MSSRTIDCGIDLGTTEAMIARLDGTNIEVFRNAEGFESTPCAVWIDKQGRLVTGRCAKEWCERDPENGCLEFKRDMGSRKEYLFARSGRKMRPEELSAEILKSLRADVQRRLGEEISAAVITVPAEFTLAASEATKRAAALAGFEQSVLLTEPVAAAQAYSFDRADDKTFWLVYDFGSGTFDASIIQVRDGLIQVVGSGGDEKLGNKNIDWAIVEQLFIPALTKDRALTNFGRTDSKWRGAMAKLKIDAEIAKIQLSTIESVEVQINFLCNDDRGEPVEFQYTFQRSELEKLTAPLIRKTVNICRETLSGRRLDLSAISKVILVGGATLMPVVRAHLSNPNEGLGIPLEFNVDPLTVVARGAAVFAGSQHLSPHFNWRKKAQAGQFGVKLDYEPVSPDTQRQVAGVVSAGEEPIKDFTGYTVEFVNPDTIPEWRSGKIGLGPKGNFTTEVSLEKGKSNNVRIVLYDATGIQQKLLQDTFQMTAKDSVPIQITLEHSVGIALPNNEVKWMLKKGICLPAECRVDFRTSISFKPGDSGSLLRSPVIQGDKSRADRNRVIGMLNIEAEKIDRDLPVGSVIEVYVAIDESRQVKTKAFIPILGEENGWFEKVIGLENPIPKADELNQRFENTIERLSNLREKSAKANQLNAVAAIQQIEVEQIVEEAARLVAASARDVDAAQQCDHVLSRLDSKMDDVEDALEWPSLVTEAEKVLEQTRKLLAGNSHTTPDDKKEFAVLERETREAIEHRIPDLLRRRLNGLAALASSLNGDFRLVVKTRKIGSNGTAEIKGTISGPIGLLPHGFCLELVNEDFCPEWRSGWLPLDPTGDFCVTASVHSEARTNEFSVALRDGAGKPKKLVPNYFVTRA